MEWIANSKTRMLYWLGLLLLNAPSLTHQELANLNTWESSGPGTGLLHFSGDSDPVVDGAAMTELVHNVQEGEGNFSLEKLGQSLSRLEGSLGSLVQSFLTVQRSVVNLEQLQELLVLLLEDILKQAANMSKGKIHKQGSEVTYQNKLTKSKSNESRDEDDEMHSEDRDRTDGGDQVADPMAAAGVMNPAGGSFDPINNIDEEKQPIVTPPWSDRDASGGESSGGSNSEENFSAISVLQTPRHDEILTRSSQWAEPMTAENTDISARVQNVISRINSRLAFASKDPNDHRVKSVPAESPLDSAPSQYEPLEIKSFDDDLLHREEKQGPVSFHVQLKQILPMISHHGHLVISHGGPLTGPEKTSTPFLEDFEDTSGKETSGERPTGMINNLLLSDVEEGNVTRTQENPVDKQIQHYGLRNRRQAKEQMTLTDERLNKDQNKSISENITNNGIILSQPNAVKETHNSSSSLLIKPTADNVPFKSQINKNEDKLPPPSKGNHTLSSRLKTANETQSSLRNMPDVSMINKTFSPEIITYLQDKKTLFASSKTKHLDTDSVKTYLTSILNKLAGTRPQVLPSLQTTSTTTGNQILNVNPEYKVRDGVSSNQLKSNKELSNDTSSATGDLSSLETKINIKLPSAKRFYQTNESNQAHSVTDLTRQDIKAMIMPSTINISQVPFDDNIKLDSKGAQVPSKGAQEPKKESNVTKDLIHKIKTLSHLIRPDESVRWSTETTEIPSQNIFTGELKDSHHQVLSLRFSRGEISTPPEKSVPTGQDDLYYNDDSQEHVDNVERFTNVLLNSFQEETHGRDSHTSDEDRDAESKNTNTILSEHDSQEIIKSRTISDEHNSVHKIPLQISNFLFRIENPYFSMTDVKAEIDRHNAPNIVFPHLPIRATSSSVLGNLIKARSKRGKRSLGVSLEQHLGPTGIVAKQNLPSPTQGRFPMSGFNFQSRTPPTQYRRHQDISPQNAGSTHPYPPHSSGPAYLCPGRLYCPHHTSLNYAHYLNNLGVNLPSLLQQRLQDHEESATQDTSMDMDDMLTRMFQRYWQRIYDHYIQSTTTESPDLDWDDTTPRPNDTQPTTAPSENVTLSMPNTADNVDGSPLLIEGTENSTASVT